MSNKHAVKEAPASYQSTPAPLGSRELQNFIAGNPLTENLNLWISATKAKSTSGRGNNKKIELVGIKKLRELILELAVRGKLVPQNPEDEPASELLKKIDAEKTKLIAEGKIKKQKKLPEISEDEKPFELPKGWEWMRLGELGETITGGTPSKNNPDFFGNDIPFIKPGDILEGNISYNGEYLSAAGKDSLGRQAPSGSILMVCIGTIGKSGIIDRACCFNQQINAVCPFFPIGEYLNKALSSYYFQNIAWEKSSSTTISILNKSKWSEIPTPLPPLMEQHRIVAKVDELMALCDQLEQHSEHQLDAHKQLVETLLATLVESENADELATNWQRLAEHFDTLFSGALTSTAGIGNGGGEWAIDRLKDTILQLAVMGKLVPQNPDDEPASELLKKIDAEKAKLVKEGKIKKQKPLPEITDEEKPFELPKEWKWARLANITDIQSGIAKGKKFSNQDTIVLPYLRVANVQRGFLILDEIKEIEILKSDIKKYSVIARDLLITEGGDWDKVGRTAVWPQYQGTMLHQNHVFKTRLILEDQNEQWLERYLNCSFARNYFAGSSKQTTNLASINKTQLSNIIVPMPPLAEQHRIVAKVDELFALCDQLKTRLQAASETQLTLTEALVEQALS